MVVPKECGVGKGVNRYRVGKVIWLVKGIKLVVGKGFRVGKVYKHVKSVNELKGLD